MLLLNLIIVSLSIWLITAINNKYLQPAIKNRYRFQLYRLRDRLSILAMSREIEESSEEYVTLLSLINSSIRATGSFKVTDFLKFVFCMHNDKETHIKLKRIMGNLEKTDNPKYCEIASEYFLLMHKILRKDTRILRFAFFPALVLVATFVSILKISRKPESVVNNKKMAIEKIDIEFDNYSNKFSNICTV